MRYLLIAVSYTHLTLPTILEPCVKMRERLVIIQKKKDNRHNK